MSEKEGVDALLEVLEGKTEYAVDVETNGLDCINNDLLLIALGDYDNQFVIDCTSVSESSLKLIFRRDILWCNHNIKFDIGFIHKPTGIRLKKVYDTMIVDQRLWLNYGYANNLYATILRYVKDARIYSDKTTRGDFINLRPSDLYRRIGAKHIIYAAEDVKYILPVKKKQLEYCDKFMITKALFDIELPLIPIISEMEDEGLDVNQDLLNKMIERNKKDLVLIEAELDEEFRRLRNIYAPDALELKGGMFDSIRKESVTITQVGLFDETDSTKEISFSKNNMNWNSNLFIIKLLSKLGLECPYINENGEYEGSSVPKMHGNTIISSHNYTTTEKVVNMYLLRVKVIPARTLWEKLFRYRELTTKLNRYGENLRDKINKHTGKLHTLFRQCDAINGRFQSGGGKEKRNDRINSQNFPREKEFRELIVAPKDYLLYTGDFTGAELITLCSKAQDKFLYKLNDNGNGDIHSFIATAAWRNILAWRGDEKFKEFVVTKKINPDKRQDGKNVHFGVFYRAGKNVVAKTLNVLVDEGFIYILTMRKLFPAAFSFIDKCVELATQRGYLVLDNRTNFRIWFKSIFEAKEAKRELTYLEAKDIGNQAANTPISGTQAIFLKHAMVNLYNFIEEEHLDAKLLLTVHDELVIKFHEKYKAWLPNKFTQIMQDTANTYFDNNLHISVEWHVANHWQK